MSTLLGKKSSIRRHHILFTPKVKQTKVVFYFLNVVNLIFKACCISFLPQSPPNAGWDQFPHVLICFSSPNHLPTDQQIFSGLRHYPAHFHTFTVILQCRKRCFLEFYVIPQKYVSERRYSSADKSYKLVLF